MSDSKKCPMCRCANYEKKDYVRDKEYYINKCIILLQRYTRGFLLRFYLYKNVFKNNMPKNKHLRSIYSVWKIKELTKNIAKAMEIKNNNVNKLIKKIEVENKAINEINKEIEKNLKINSKNEESDDIWYRILKEIKTRDDVCAICFTSMWNKEVYITSCSHCFHKNCLDSFERFDNYYAKRCPCCRQNYEKKKIKLI
jgi:transcriptional regulator NrdR family protein